MSNDLKAMNVAKAIVGALQFIVSQQPVDGRNMKAQAAAGLVDAMDFIEQEIARAQDRDTRYDRFDR